jgi:hypothetical protein
MRNGPKKCVLCTWLMLLVAACAQGGADSAPGWALPVDDPSDALAEGAPQADDSDASALDFSPEPASPSLVPGSSADTVPQGDAIDGGGDGDDGGGDDGSVVVGTAVVGSDAGGEQAFDPDSSSTPPPLLVPSTPDPSGPAIDASASSPEPPPSVAPPALGSLLITEVMFAPFGPSPQAQWFEVYNTGESPAILSGLTILDGAMRSHTIAFGASGVPVVAPVRSFVLLVRDRAVAIASGLPPDAIVYEYGARLADSRGVLLDDGPSGAVSLWNGDLELASAPYGSWGLVALGQSVELAALQLVGSDLAESWCYAEAPWAPGSDYGTPGAPNDCNFP